MGKIQYGICNIHVAFMGEPGEDGAPTWETPRAVRGATKLTLDENGSSNPFYADNGIYAEMGSASGLSGSLELALFPLDFVAEAMGYRIDSNGGLVEVSGGTKKPFALGFQFETDDEGRRNWLYNVTLSRPSDEHNTTEGTITPDVQNADFTASPIELDGENVYKYTLPMSDKAKTVYNSFFASVVKPAAKAVEQGA